MKEGWVYIWEFSNSESLSSMLKSLNIADIPWLKKTCGSLKYGYFIPNFSSLLVKVFCVRSKLNHWCPGQCCSQGNIAQFSSDESLNLVTTFANCYDLYSYPQILAPLCKTYGTCKHGIYILNERHWQIMCALRQHICFHQVSRDVAMFQQCHQTFSHIFVKSTGISSGLGATNAILG